MKSAFLTLNIKDFAKGFATAFLSAFLTAVYTVLESAFTSGTFPALVAFKPALFVGLLAGLGYISKNVLTNSEDEILKKDPEKTDSVQFKARA